MSRKDLRRKVGDFITPIRAVIQINQTVEEALLCVRKEQIAKKIFYFYVVDHLGYLRGVLSTRSLLLSPPQSNISDVLEEQVVSISANHTLEEAMQILTHHRLLAIPVTDEEGLLLGVIDIQLYLEEAIDIPGAKRRATDLFQVLGLKLEEGKNQSIWRTYATRMPWVFCNMIGGVVCAIISRVFEVVLLDAVILAMFIPLVLTLSESISMQSMTYSLQLLNRPKISHKRIVLRILSEGRIVFLLAVTCGVIVGNISLLWEGGIPLSVTISGAITLSIIISSIFGASIPLFLHAQKLDPKVAAGPVVLMFADIITTAIYLGLSTAWLIP